MWRCLYFICKRKNLPNLPSLLCLSHSEFHVWRSQKFSRPWYHFDHGQYLIKSNDKLKHLNIQFGSPIMMGGERKGQLKKTMGPYELLIWPWPHNHFRATPVPARYASNLPKNWRYKTSHDCLSHKVAKWFWNILWLRSKNSTLSSFLPKPQRGLQATNIPLMATDDLELKLMSPYLFAIWKRALISECLLHH